eukprot:GGOE01012390.1.p1 GENE.GGOE01012390.1~~GGOE01012390.1.p1  ORF type:complete len:619 (-),score=153.50 GGOE01012390.1:1891-3612(-)
MSENLQLCHLGSFFTAEFPLRHPLSSGLQLSKTMEVLQDGLAKLGSARIWYRLHHSLRMLTKVRLGLHRFHLHTRCAREALLEEWLLFWRTTESQHQEYLRRSLQPSLIPSPRKGKDSFLAHAMAITPDSIKCEVLWELYWLVRTQHTRNVVAHQRKLRALMRERQQVRSALRSSGSMLPTSLSQDAILRPLAVVDAEIFVTALRRPRLRCCVGSDITFRDLLRMQGSDCTQLLEMQGSTPSMDAFGLLSSPTMAFFLASPLCQDVAWFERRLMESRRLVPPMRWAPQQPQSSPRTCALQAKKEKALSPAETKMSPRAHPSLRRPGMSNIPSLVIGLCSPRVQPAASPPANSRSHRLCISPTQIPSPRQHSSKTLSDQVLRSPGSIKLKSPRPVPTVVQDGKRLLVPVRSVDSPPRPHQSPPTRHLHRLSSVSLHSTALLLSPSSSSLASCEFGFGRTASLLPLRSLQEIPDITTEGGDEEEEDEEGLEEVGRGERSRSPSPPHHLLALRCLPGIQDGDAPCGKGSGFLTIPCVERRSPSNAQFYGTPLPNVRGRGCSVSRRLSDLDLHATGT